MARETYDIGDEVVLVKEREGFIRYIGPLDGKKGTFYGIEVSVGSGKHDGEHSGTKYFKCGKGKGMFIQEKHIIFKLNEKSNKPKKSKKKKPKKQPSPSPSQSQSSSPSPPPKPKP
eukprot:60591_1